VVRERRCAVERERYEGRGKVEGQDRKDASMEEWMEEGRGRKR
jgi:hypothetical protein